MENRTDFYTFQHGQFGITMLSDGPILLGGEIFAPEGSKDQREEILLRLQGDRTIAPAQSNIPLIVTTNERILVDVGAGNRFQPTEGQLEENLASAGLNAADITVVILSHAHPDHIWGMLRDDGTLRFPNARYFVGRQEFEYWTGDEASALPDGLQSFVQGARRDLDAIAGHAIFFEDGDEILPGIKAMATPGHTAGHSSFVLEGNTPLVITVDAIASEIVSVEHPDWSFGFDMDVARARETRLALLERIAAKRAKLIGFHWTYPGVGEITRSETGFAFIPAQRARP
ncbi:metallo-beta-lactamase superfamily protein (plasmid) [Ensifer adhaerens OV14]|nr:metallo-beta-lactamase superfamily protein [Ensifer adhaerens OV14]